MTQSNTASIRHAAAAAAAAGSWAAAEHFAPECVGQISSLVGVRLGGVVQYMPHG